VKSKVGKIGEDKVQRERIRKLAIDCEEKE